MSERAPSVVGMDNESTNESVVVDCDSCLVRSPGACGDCVVTVLLGAPPSGIELDADDLAAIGALSDAGCVPPLRLVTPVPGPRWDVG